MIGKIAKAPVDHFRVALLIETSHEFGREVLRGIHDYEQAQVNPWAFYLQPDGMRQSVPKIGTWQCTGIIARFFHAETEKRLLRSKLPLVVIDPDFSTASSASALRNIPYMTTDADAIAEIAFRHLRACGCQTFAFVHSLPKTPWSVSRAKAFHERATREGCACLIHDPPKKNRSWEQEIHHLGDWLARLPEHPGVFAAVDQRGRQVIEACRERHLRVPDDVMVLSVDNDPLLCELCEPPMSSIALDAHRAGYEAAQLLDQMMRGHAVKPGTCILVRPTHVSRRTSTASGFAQDEVVAEARRFIFDHLSDRSMQISMIAAHCGVSRRLLEKRFHQAVGHTLLQELTNMRMERARTLLRDTRETIASLSSACGFNDPNYFTKAFRRHHGCSPQTYRKSSLERD